jgi:hypothetical protein
VPRKFAAAPALVLAVAMVWFGVHLRPQDHRPLALPDRFAGIPRMEGGDFGTSSDWPGIAHESLGTPLFAGGSYLPPKAGNRYGRPWLNVVAARADMSGTLDLRMAGDDGQRYGDTRCTTNVVLPGTHDSLGPGRLLCWRTSRRLSVSALVVFGPAEPAAIAGGVDELWAQLV